MSAPDSPFGIGETALEREPVLRQVLKALPDGVFTVDPSGTITYWNQAMETLTGLTAAEALGQPCSVIRGEECFNGPRVDGQTLPCNLFHCAHIQSKKCHIHRADGGVIPVLKNGSVLYSEDGTLLGGIETVTDIRHTEQLEREVERLRGGVRGRWGLVGRHPGMERLFERIALAARSDASVLILGETGTGKELVAKAIHDESPRRAGPFVRVSCAALSEGLLESELFGHVRGAFTGAVQDRIGRFEAAHGGTLFLDEIGEISPATQVKLLRVLQDHLIERVGSNRTIHTDIRVIAATNRNLEGMAANGSFRADLFYRLAVFPIRVPPLRERREDIPLLVEHLLQRHAERDGRPTPSLSAEAMALLVRRGWAGNVRELEHALAYASAVAAAGQIEVVHLPPLSAPCPCEPGTAKTGIPSPNPARRGRLQIAEVIAALQATGGNRAAAAARLGVSRMTLWRWLKDADAAEAAEVLTP